MKEYRKILYFIVPISILVVLVIVTIIIKFINGGFALSTLNQSFNSVFEDNNRFLWDPGIQKNVSVTSMDDVVYEVYEYENDDSIDLVLSGRNLNNDKILETYLPYCSPHGDIESVSSPYIHTQGTQLVISWVEKLKPDNVGLCVSTFNTISKEFILNKKLVEGKNIYPLIKTAKLGHNPGTFLAIWAERTNDKYILLGKAFNMNGFAQKPKDTKAPMDLKFFYYGEEKIANGWSIPIEKGKNDHKIIDFQISTNYSKAVNGATVVWKSQRSSDGTEIAQIASISNDIKVSQGPININLSLTPKQIGGFDLACSPGGTCIVAFQMKYQDQSHDDILGLSFNPWLVPMSSVKRLNTVRIRDQRNPSLAWGNDLNAFFLAYETDHSSLSINVKSEKGVLLEIIELTGKVQGSPKIVTKDKMQEFRNPKLVTGKDWMVIKYEDASDLGFTGVSY